jgi:N-acetyl-gamma-glutamyl-phosphate reductase
MNPIPLFVVGAKGLLAAEMLRLAAAHAGIGECHAFSRSEMPDLRAVHPQLPQPQPVRNLTELPTALNAALNEGQAALVLATPHGVSSTLWADLQADLLQLGAKLNDLYVVDLSEDHRLHDGTSKKGAWHYGLPELHDVPSSARHVAVAGCFATAMQLAVVPLQAANLLKAHAPLIIQGVTASSGSGAIAKQGTHHPFRESNFHPYAMNGHRHEKELCHLRNFQNAPTVVFLPYSAPLGRGIYLTAHISLKKESSGEQINAAFEANFLNSPFIELMPNQAPQLRSIIGSNRAAIGWNHRDGMAQVFVALDNTIKGGAGQGLQCLNLMLGLPEITGLPLAGLGY